MTESEWMRPRPLDKGDETDSFSCGQPDLDVWLAKHALPSQKANSARVYVSAEPSSRIAGFYAISAGGVEPPKAPSRVAKGLSRNPVPVIILTRLAIALEHQGKGLGRNLLIDCLRRVATVSESVGVRALLIHAKDEDAASFYRYCAEFEPSPTDPLHLFLLMKDLRKALSH